MDKIDDPQIDLSALSELAPELAQLMVSVACDIALVLDDGGVIQSVARGGSRPGPDDPGAWVGQRWTEVVTSETRQRAEQFLSDLSSDGVSRLRHLSHASDAGAEIPMAYTAVKLGDQGLALAVGRDMRLVAAMQERLTSAQREIEKDYWNRRRAETRYRVLFQVSAEPMIIVDAGTHNIIDVNRAAEAMLENSGSEAYGKPLSRYFAPSAHEKLEGMLESARSATRAVVDRTELSQGTRIDLTIAPFEFESASVLCLILRSAVAPALESATFDSALRNDRLARLCELTTESIGLCDLAGKLLFANAAFKGLVQWPRDDSMMGCHVSTLFENGEEGWRNVLSLARKQHAQHLLNTTLRRANSSRIEVELSATVLADFNCVGLLIRVCHTQRSDSVAFDEFEQKGFH